MICNYDILPKNLVPTKDSGKKTKNNKIIKVADLNPEDAQALSETSIIADEIHLCKNYEAARSQKVTQLSRGAKRFWGLTGTPLMNRPQDLYGVLSVCYLYPLGGWHNFVSLFNGFCNEFGGYEFGMPTEEVPERLKRVMLRRLKSEVLSQ